MILHLIVAFPTYTKPLHRRRSSLGAKTKRCDLFDFHNELVPYKLGWAWQHALVERKKEEIKRGEESHDSLIVLQHHPVYTMGTGSSTEFLKFDPTNSPVEVHRTERGGEVTYHGPGQLVMYPILNLRNHRKDLHWYLRALEEVVIRALSSSFSMKSCQVPGLTGVWDGDRKIAAIGVKVTRWIAYHGVAVNVTADLAAFDWIVPCGIRNRRVGSVKQILCESSTDISNDSLLLETAFRSLLHEFSELFQVTLFPQTHCGLSTSHSLN